MQADTFFKFVGEPVGSIEHAYLRKRKKIIIRQIMEPSGQLDEDMC